MVESDRNYKLKPDEILRIYESIKPAIDERLSSFRRIWDGGCIEIFQELIFCLLTPGSKAKMAWVACEKLSENGLLFSGDEDEISNSIRWVRFKNNKAKNIVLARKRFIKDGGCVLKSELVRFGSVFEKRRWLVNEVRGFGFKEASHFLRNIGFFEEIAILDRHILRGMLEIGLISDIPKSLTPSRYLRLEKLLSDYAKEINIPLSALDFVLWYRKAGEIFK